MADRVDSFFWDDYVVDVVVDVRSGRVDLDALAGRVELPGIALERVTSRGAIGLTAIVAASGEGAACREVRASVRRALLGIPGADAATMVTGVALGELYARLDGDLSDEEVQRIDVRDLVDQVWDRPDLPTRRQALEATG